MRKLPFLLVIGALGLAPRLAEADEAGGKTESSSWYGWQILPVDVASLGLTALAIVDDDVPSELAIVGLGAYLLGGPVVHVVHGHGGTAGASFAMRLGIPLVGTPLVYGASVAGGEAGWATVAWGALGALSSTVAASLIDAIALAWEAAPLSPRASIGAAPVRGGGVAGVTVAF